MSNNKQKKPVNEALKEVGRYIVFFVISILLAEIPALLGIINKSTGEIDINWQIIVAIVLATALRGVDKLLHEKRKGDSGQPSGLINF